MNTPTRRVLILGLLLSAFGFHLAVAWQDFVVLARNGFLYDDSFYAFKIAHNIAQGNGITFDGLTGTNGFQPLWVFLLVPIFWVTGSNLIAPIYAALTVSSILTAVTAVLLFRIAVRYVSQWVAVAAAAIWAFSPVVIRQGSNGLETSLTVCLLAAIVYFYLSRVRSVDNARPRDFVVLGILMGLGVLARVDQVFVVLAVLLDYLLVVRARSLGVGPLRGVGKAFLAGAIVYSPWAFYNAFAMGNVFQDSGAATRFLSIAYAPFFDLGSGEGPTLSFMMGHLSHAASVLKTAPPVHTLFRILEKLGLMTGSETATGMLGVVVGFALLGLFLAWALFRRSSSHARALGELRFLLVIAFALVASYSFYVFGVFFFTRYMYPVYFILCVYFAVLGDGVVQYIRRTPKLRFVAIAGTAAYALGFAYMSVSSAYRSTPVYMFYDAAKWVTDNTAQGERIGVFQGGAVGYLSGRDIVNLDGKVNRQALDALKAHKLVDYIQTTRVDVLIDHADVLQLFVGTDKRGKAIFAESPRIMDGARDGGPPGWSAFRISDALTTRRAPAGVFMAPRLQP